MVDFILSVVVPIYNVERYLRECLDSIYASDMSNKQVILVNDGSTDGSLSIAQEYALRPNTILINKTNGGLSDARNAGMEAASGEFIAFIDSDDIINGVALDRMVNAFIEDADADILVAYLYEYADNLPDHKIIRYDKSLFTKPLITLQERLDTILSIRVAFSACNKLYRQSFLKQENLYFTKDILHEDLDFTFRTFYRATRIIKSEEIFYGYRQREGSIMHTLDVRILDKISIFEQMRLLVESSGEMSKFKKGFGALYMKLALSIFYIVYITRKQCGRDLSLKITDKLMDGSSFRYYMQSKGRIEFRYLRFREIILYWLLRFKIITKVTIRWFM